MTRSLTDEQSVVSWQALLPDSAIAALPIEDSDQN